MLMDRRGFFTGLTTFTAIIGFSSLTIPRLAHAAIVGPVKFSYPRNPLHVRAMILLREVAKKLLNDGEAEFTMISATCRYLRGETDTYDIWLVTMYAFDGLYRAAESLAELGLSMDEINAALHRLDIEMELKHLLIADAPGRES